ncbi:hypothetical protein A9Q74_00305 [Colwellia sp. 39_35_sub15_T18]|nr:hypothetical protein A9Q74_00305 [Colwellia sp. 39_35_sub15_T18]
MFYRTAFKWLTITVMVLGAFLVVLLFLGYLLKENEAATTKLKAQLEQEVRQQQAKEADKNKRLARLKTPLTTAEQSQQTIIMDNQGCETDKQCFLVHTHSQNVGCIVSVNTKGAAILLKVAGQNKDSQLTSNSCQQEYTQQQSLLAQCQQNRCSF